MKRRDLVHGAGVGILGLIGSRLHAAGFRQRRVGEAFEPDVDLTLTAAPGAVQILAGQRTRVWQYTSVVHRGPSDTLQPVANSYLGPTIRLRQGQKVRIRFRNNLPEPSIVHWHGLDVPEAADGHPHSVVGPGAEYLYEFDVLNRAGTCWYHPHPHGKTGSQVYQGLTGMLIIGDTEEDALKLPGGADDLTWVVQDRNFDAANQLSYLRGGMMDRMHGLLATTMLVNGRLPATLPLATRAYRIRLLNGSSSRVLKLTWDDGTPMQVISVDGGLLERPISQEFLTLAPSQRADVILDLSKHAVGSRVQLRSAAYDGAEVSINEGGMGGMMGGMAGGGLPNGAPLPLTTVHVARKERSTFTMPARLGPALPTLPAAGLGPTRRITLDFRAGQWLLDGATFEMMTTTPQENVVAGSHQVWEVANVGGMMGMQMAHPFHVHGTQFRVLSRVRSAGTSVPAHSVREGLVDGDLHDTVLVLPGETLRLQMHFTRYPGLYLYHCHILEHEDMGMMRNFRVTT